MIFFNVITFLAHIILVSTLSYMIYKSTIYYLDDPESYSQLTQEILINKIGILLKSNSINYKLVRDGLKITYLCIKSCLDDNISNPFVITINPHNNINKKGVFYIRIKYLKLNNDIVQLFTQITNIVRESSKINN